MTVTEFVRSARDSPGPRDWILDIFGSFVRDAGGWIPVAGLLTLLDSVGIGSASGRSTLSRMKAQDELQAVAKGGVRGYSLTESAERWFAYSTPRIMGTEPINERQVEPAPADHPIDGTGGATWIMATFTVPETERPIRYRIRTRLKALGFGQLSGGLMIAPVAVFDETVDALRRAELDGHVDLWRSDHLGFGSLTEQVAGAWNLAAIRQTYAGYLQRCAELDRLPAPVDDEEAFVRYLTHVNAWRELPYLDPGIPTRFLPDDWLAQEARSAFTRIAADLRPAAERHFTIVSSQHSNNRNSNSSK